MSGTAFGTIVPPVTRDSASGSPLAPVRDGDRIEFSIRQRRFDLLVDEAALGAAPACGCATLHAREILGVDRGRDCDFPKTR